MDDGGGYDDDNTIKETLVHECIIQYILLDCNATLHRIAVTTETPCRQISDSLTYVFPILN